MRVVPWLVVLAVLPLLLLWLFIGAPPSGVPGHRQQVAAVVVFGIHLLLCSLAVFGAGKIVTRSWTGTLLASRNRYSLSRLQAACWTVVVLGALLTSATLNLFGTLGPVVRLPDDPPTLVRDALQIDVPGDLLAALGIAGFSLAAAPAILALKRGQEPTSAEEDTGRVRQAAASGTNPSDVLSDGKVVQNARPENARWFDILSGDELATAGTVDLSKVQQLLITALLLLAYAGMMVKALATAKVGISTLPPLGTGFVQLLAVSHAGYLGYKVMPKQPQAADPAPPAAGTADVRQELRIASGALPAGPRR